MLLEFEGASQEEEPKVQATDEAATEEELLECPDHRPSSFLKGKPQSILSLLCFENDYFEYLYMFDALSDRNWMQTLVAYISIPYPVHVP